MQRGEWLAAEMERFRVGFEAGNFASCIEALQLCVANDYPLPAWLGVAAIDLAVAVHEGRPPTGSRGAGNSYHRRLARDRQDHQRWAVAERFIRIVEVQKAELAKLTADQKRLLRQHPELKRLNGKHPLSRKGAYAAAAEVLGETHVQAGAIAKAHARVAAAKRNGERDRYTAAADTFTPLLNRRQK